MSRTMRRERANCYICGEPVMIPPGVIYRDLKVHKHCARARSRVDDSDELIAPMKAEDEDILRSYMHNMGNTPS